MAKNIEVIEGVREIIVFTASGNVLAHNVQSFAVKKAVLVFLFHHLTAQAAQNASQLTPSQFLAAARGQKLLIGHLAGEIYVAITANPGLDHDRIFQYLKTCAQSQA